MPYPERRHIIVPRWWNSCSVSHMNCTVQIGSLGQSFQSETILLQNSIPTSTDQRSADRIQASAKCYRPFRSTAKTKIEKKRLGMPHRLKKADLISEEPDLVHGGRSDLEDDVRLEGRGLVHDFSTGAFVIWNEFPSWQWVSLWGVLESWPWMIWAIFFLVRWLFSLLVYLSREE